MTISSDDSTWIIEQITLTETAIAAINAAIIAIAGGSQSYELDTGLSSQRVRVTKADIGDLTNALKSYIQLRTTYRSMLGLPNAVGYQTHVIPGF